MLDVQCSEFDSALLDDLAALLPRFVVLPKHAAETLALWIIHTWCFKFRDVSTYLGVESPVKRCGKTTLLSVLGKLVNRPVVASNISPSAFFRVIEEMQPTLLIDEADTLLQGHDELRGILNAGYHKPNAYVIRVSNEPASRKVGTTSTSSQISDAAEEEIPMGTTWKSSLPSSSGPSTLNSKPSTLATYSAWCPKVIAAIGHLPETLADRCILIRMQRKRGDEQCERLRNLDSADSPVGTLSTASPSFVSSILDQASGIQQPESQPATFNLQPATPAIRPSSHTLRHRCAQFALDHQHAIANARPEIPEALNDRAADIWEPLLAIADIAGGSWPEKARAAAVALTTGAQENSPSTTLLFDIGILFVLLEKERLFTSQIVDGLNQSRFATRPWREARKGKPVTEIWLAQQLRPFGVRPKNLRIDGDQGKGYDVTDLRETFGRYIPQSELDNFKAELSPPETSDPTSS